MAIAPDDLRRELLALSVAEHADLAAELLVSLETPSEDDRSVVRSPWSQEIEQRARGVLAGETETHDWTTVRRRLADTLGG
jgi:hypothetical protein